MTAVTSERADLINTLIGVRGMVLGGGYKRDHIVERLDVALETLSAGPLHPAQAEQRNTHDVLISLCQLAEEQLAVSRHILAALNRPSSESRSSVEFDSNGSAGKVKVKVKEYVDQPVDETLIGLKQKFTAAMADIEDAQSAGWRATVNGLAAEGAVAHG